MGRTHGCLLLLGLGLLHFAGSPGHDVQVRHRVHHEQHVHGRDRQEVDEAVNHAEGLLRHEVVCESCGCFVWQFTCQFQRKIEVSFVQTAMVRETHGGVSRFHQFDSTKFWLKLHLQISEADLESAVNILVFVPRRAESASFDPGISSCLE